MSASATGAAGAVRERAKRWLVAAVSRSLYQTRARTPYGEPYVPSPRSWKRGAAELNRRLFERGMAPPWVLSAAGCERYWASRSDEDEQNSPGSYASKPLDIVDFIDQFWSPEVSASDSVLELGSSSGANLEGLRRHGFTQLSGVEINTDAVGLMRDAFPDLAGAADVEVGSLADVLPGLPSNSYDVILTVATLIHVHPTTNTVMSEMMRIARRFICVVETEWVTMSYVFARDYQRVFERLGAEQVSAQRISSGSLAGSTLDGYVGYTARLFRVPPAV